MPQILKYGSEGTVVFGDNLRLMRRLATGTLTISVDTLSVDTLLRTYPLLRIHP